MKRACSLAIDIWFTLWFNKVQAESEMPLRMPRHASLVGPGSSLSMLYDKEIKRLTDSFVFADDMYNEDITAGVAAGVAVDVAADINADVAADINADVAAE